jgi:hypothetical protein
MVDTVEAIQVGQDPDRFESLEEFTKNQGLRRVTFGHVANNAARKYTLVVFPDGHVVKAITTRTGLKTRVFMQVSSRNGQMFMVKRKEEVRLYQ